MPTTDYDEYLFEQLRDPEFAAEYLSVSAKDGTIEEFLLALRDVAQAYGGIGMLSDATNLNRQSMYKMLSEDGNPTLVSLIAVLKAVGIEMRFAVPSDKDAA